MRVVFDAPTAIVAARVSGDLGRTIDEADGVFRGHEGERLPDERVGDRVVVAVEPDVSRDRLDVESGLVGNVRLCSFSRLPVSPPRMPANVRGQDYDDRPMVALRIPRDPFESIDRAEPNFERRVVVELVDCSLEPLGNLAIQVVL
jgi:hypothetical protein